MIKSKLIQFNAYSINFIFEEIFKLDSNVINPIKLPDFPNEINVDTTKLHNGLEKISDFAISRYLINDFANVRPNIVFRVINTFLKKGFQN
tara:strand:+ start:1618 stop:1890 length:273 start_codon:yes stop_codon:yes gene_type:complete